MADIAVIRECFQNREYVFTAHASDRAAQRGIRAIEIEEAVERGEIIEDYPDDKYGPSCLIFGHSNHDRPLHIQVSYPSPIKIITVYQPTIEAWGPDFRTRKPE